VRTSGVVDDLKVAGKLNLLALPCRGFSTIGLSSALRFVSFCLCKCYRRRRPVPRRDRSARLDLLQCLETALDATKLSRGSEGAAGRHGAGGHHRQLADVGTCIMKCAYSCLLSFFYLLCFSPRFLYVFRITLSSRALSHSPLESLWSSQDGRDECQPHYADESEGSSLGREYLQVGTHRSSTFSVVYLSLHLFVLRSLLSRC
jgi:hypothetical protein